MSKQSQRGILSRLHLSLAAAASLLLALGACSGDVASPAARQPVDVSGIGPAFGRSGGGGSGKNLHSNRDRYRNRGRGHGYGRVNDIEVEGMALLGADRVTRLTLSTGTIDPLAAGNGSITKVQVKAYTPDGQKLYVNNFNHLTPAGIQTLPLNGLAVGSLLYIRAHVRGARAHNTNCGCDDRGRGHDRDDDDHGSSRGRGHDRDGDRDRDDNRWDRRSNHDDDDCDDDPRTDVVTLVDTVKAAAALRVDVQLPPTATVGLPVVITGVVSEINGDVGTRANCELWVNGRLVDSAVGIWVDAGDAVSCAFSYTFPTTGTQNVEVRVRSDGSGSSSQAVITSGGTVNVGGGFTTGYSAQVEDRTVSSTTVFAYTWSKPDGSHKEYSNTEVNSERNQTMNVQGTIERAAVFPLARVSLAMESNGVEWQTEQWEGLASTAAADGRQCISRDMPAYGATFFLCNGLLGGASWGYQRFAGNVTYHSHGYSNTFDGIAGVQDLYSWNDNYTTYAFGGQVRALGSALLMRLTISDAAGSVSFSPAVPVPPFANVLSVTPEACVTTRPEGLEGGSLTECRSARSDDAGWRGSSTG